MFSFTAFQPAPYSLYPSSLVMALSCCRNVVACSPPWKWYSKAAPLLDDPNMVVVGQVLGPQAAQALTVFNPQVPQEVFI